MGPSLDRGDPRAADGIGAMPLRTIWHRLRALVLRRRLDRDLHEEMAFHLTMREAEHRARGLDAADARAATLRQFGNVTLLTERTRDMWVFPRLETIRQDVRYAVRLLRRSPAFSLVSIAVLALGIGSNITIFAMLDAVTRRVLPYPAPDRLVVLWGNVQREKVERRGASYPDFLDWRAQATRFDGMAAATDTRLTLSGAGDAVRIPAEFVSASYFSALGVTPAIGRTFLPEEDDVAHRTPVVVLSDGLWRRAFGGDPRVVGQRVLLSGQPYTVVGIMRPGFVGLTDRADAWVPFVMSDSPDGLADRGSRSFNAVARLKPGVTIAAARTEMDGISRRLERAYPATNDKRGVEVEPLDQELLGVYRPGLRMLMGAVAFILLIGCANVVNLQLARAETRRREIAVRTAMGAAWTRVVRQLVTEAALLTALAAGVGIVLAHWSIATLLRHSPVEFPSFVHPHLSGRVLAFTIAVTSVCAIVMGLAPAAHGRVERLADALRSSERGSSAGTARRTRGALVVAEVASALILVAGAGLMIRSAQRLMAVDPGFDPRGVIALRVSIPRAAPSAPDAPARLEISARVLLDRIRGLPGVVAASLVTDPPFSGLESAVFYGAEGQPALDAQHRPRAYVHSVTPEFFKTMGIRQLAGRTFSETEQTPSVATVVVSEQVVRRFWPGQDPIGKRIKIGGVTSTYSRWLTIVGVVADVKYRGLPENPTSDPDLYFPFTDRNPQISLVVRADGDASSLAAPIRRLVREIDPNVPVYAVNTMDSAIAEQTARARFTTWIMSGFGALALLLASIGVYGVMAYLVARRRRELGIRMELGADRRTIVRLVVRGGGRLIAVGLAGGIAGVVVLERLARTLLFGVGAFDPATCAAAAVLGITGLLACYLPALRAARVSPLEAFRAD